MPLLEDIQIFVVYWAIYRQELQYAVKHVVLRHCFDIFDSSCAIRHPYDERDFVLFLRGKIHWDTVHIEVFLPQRFSVVGDKNHCALVLFELFQVFDDSVQYVIGIYNGVVVGIHQLFR